jgi:hypothetical protein
LVRLRGFLPLGLAISVGAFAYYAAPRITVAGIGIVAWNDQRGRAEMRGCTTILSFIFIPVGALIFAGLHALAHQPWFNSALGWAGVFRLPVLLFAAAWCTAFVHKLRRDYRRRKSLKTRHISSNAIDSLGPAILAAIIGAIWIGIAQLVDQIILWLN